MPSRPGAAAAAVQSTNAALVVTVFQTSLDNLLLTATRHRTMSPLRDAVQSARIKGFTAEDIFHTFVLACDMLHGRRQLRPLLMQSLSDLGKMASLRMLPMSCSVIHVICRLVQKLLGRTQGGSLNLLQGGLRSTTAWGWSSRDSLAGTLLLDAGAAPEVAELREGSISVAPGAGDVAMDAQPPDEELQMRILQTLMAYLSACELGNAALSDIISVLFLMYMQAAPGSLVEATCAATIEERTQALLRCLRSGGDARQGEDDNSAFTAQIQAVAYAKDVCALCAGAAPKWLKLDAPRSSSISTGPVDVLAAPVGAPPPAPRRLRLLLLRTLTAHFAEGERITSTHEASVFLTQLLNEDVVSVVLGRVRSQSHSQRAPGESNLEQPAEPNLVDLVSPNDELPDAEEFALMQQLGVVALSKALPVMRHAMPVVLRHHVMLVKLCGEEDGGEVGENARRMAVVLTLWRKAIADHELLQQLLLLTASSSALLPAALPTASPPGPTPSQRHETQQQQQQQQQQARASEDGAAAALLNPFTDPEDVAAEGASGMHPFADLVTLTAELLSDVIIASEGTLNLDHPKATAGRPRPATASVVGGEHPWGALSTAFSRPLQLPSTLRPAREQEDGEGASHGRGPNNGTETRHPATAQAADVLSFLTMFTQSFARVVEASRLGEAVNAPQSRTTDVGARAAGVAALFTSLHAPLLRCFALAAQHLQGDDVIHMVLKGTTHLVQTSCNLALPVQRDSYLQIFVTRLYMPPERRHPVEGEATRSQQRRPVSDESASPAPSTRSPPLAGRGRTLPGKTTPEMQSATTAAALNRSLEALQEKLYVLNCVISVANCMGASLGEGWRPVASCLLLTEPLLKEVHSMLEQQQRQSQYEAVDDIAVQDVSRNAGRVRDALHLLFIHTALLPDGVALEGILKSFVTETCRRSPSSYLPSLRMNSECCSLALLTVAACRPDVSLAQLRRLWCTVKALYLHVFDPANLVGLVEVCRHSDRTMEAVGGVLERLVEDIAVVTAQLCQRVNSSVGETKAELQQQGEEKEEAVGFRFAAGPYATAGLVTRLATLLPSPTRVQQGPVRAESPAHHMSEAEPVAEAEPEAEAEVEAGRRELLAAPTELLAMIYGHLQESQQRQEEPQGETEELATHVGEAVEAVTRGAALVVLKEVLKLVQGFGEELRGAAWEHLLRLLRHTAAPSGARWNSAPTTAPLASVKQSIGIAFRALETIQHSCITSLDDEGLRQLIRCGGAFMTHHFPGFEHRLNINLSAVQLLWSVADYVVSRETGESKNDDLLWCTLLLQLYDGCLDVRPEVRQSALKTLFSLLQTYGGRLSAECWRCVLLAVLAPLMDVALQAATTCAAAADAPAAPSAPRSRRCSVMSQHLRRRSSETGSTSLSESGSAQYGGYTSEEEWCISRLLTHLGKQPALFEDMRVTIMDAVCRVFASHYQVMHAVLVLNCTDAQRRTDGEVLLRETLALFIELCGTSRLVARNTSGENAALSAVRALHVLMTAPDPALLTETELETAWIAIEQLLHGGGSTSARAWPKQCTAAVVATIVSSLGDVVAMRLAGNAQQPHRHDTAAAPGPPATAPVSVSPSFFAQLCHAFTPSPSGLSSSGSRGRHDYFPHYMRLVQECLFSPAVTESYFFPGRVQSAVIGVWKMLWPALSAHERGAVVNVALQLFPTRVAVMSFVTQRVTPRGKKRASTTETRAVAVTITEPAAPQEAEPLARQLSLSESLPPGSHPSFLLALLEFLRAVAGEEAVEAPQQQGAFHSSTAPAVLRAAGVLLLLEYASPASLAVAGPGVPFHIPPDFFDRVERCLTSFLGDLLCGEASNPASTPQQAASTEAAAATMRPLAVHGRSDASSAPRRERLLAFASVFSSLVAVADAQLGATVGTGPQGVSSYNEAPEHLRGALQRLERFVLLLSELLSTVIRRSGDMASATELLAALVPASSLESPPLAAVAKCSLDVLRRWSLSPASSSSPSSSSTLLLPPPSSLSSLSRTEEDCAASASAVAAAVAGDADADDAALEGEKLSGRLKRLARASMGARNRAVLRRFLAHPANEELRQMMKTTLRTIILLYPPGPAPQQPPSGRHSPGTTPARRGHHAASAEDTEEGERELLQGDLVELARLVELTGEDGEFRSLLSRAMLGICASLGFSSST
ncbi:uncharacterized protein Tco025E_02690 [Trypanosoma conorhini]|uniref:Mon2 C-terminal domain-containing protein n=1 Tax=Trypanosoma conorhini TaxID=83891 RepID=A0A422Q1W0_9TRYP|nr:uncharacterized protein Tco025E_02690 [Trypanosoma conorhini]RNF23953.1 hypothetical protein Tco025E_02690 [Trypanosoma conorhini]